MNQETIHNLIKKYEKILNEGFPSVKNWIIEVGGILTAATNGKEIYLHETYHPTLFTQDEVIKINNIGFRDGKRNPVVLEIYSKKTWYTLRLKSLKELIEA